MVAFIVNKSILLAIILIASFIASHFARRHWVLELFTNFILQYAIGGLVLGVVLLVLGHWIWALACFAVFAASLHQVIRAFPVNANTQAQGPKFTIAHYNRFYFNKRDDELLDWLRGNANTFDVVSVQETTTDSIDRLAAIRDIYPYWFPETKTAETDVVLLSKTPILESGFINTDGALSRSAPGLRIRIEIQKIPVTVYAIHTHTPTGLVPLHKRTQELSGMAQAIAKDTSDNIVFTGDWNITPFSPYFQDTLKTSGLQNGYSSHWPAVTWPSTFYFPFLKIQIDQILFSKKMTLIEKRVEPATGSDHHPVVAKFALKGEN